MLKGDNQLQIGHSIQVRGDAMHAKEMGILQGIVPTTLKRRRIGQVRVKKVTRRRVTSIQKAQEKARS